MAYFARIEEGVVVEVLSVSDNQEHRGQEFLAEDLRLGGVWVQTSYNTRGGVHLTGGTPFRKNYAGIGYTYDPERDAFIPPKPFNSWLLNEDTCLWGPPTPCPDDGNIYMWDEATVSWVLADGPL
jgi:hypothetical protein